MILCCDDDLPVPCRKNVSCEMIKIKSTYEIQIAGKIKDILGAVNLSTKVWSSYVYRGYIAVTMHWIDK